MGKLEDVYKELQEKYGYDVFYIALYGSQNYNLQTENSDLDFKAIIIPTLEDLVRQTKPTSKVYMYEWGQVEVKDIRNYIESAVKVNINFIELLTTEYWYSEKWFYASTMRDFFEPLLKEQGEIYLRANLGMIMQKYHAFSHPFPSKLAVIEKFGYDPKQLCHIVRLRILMERYLEGNLSYIHEWDQRDYLIHLKSGSIVLENAIAIATFNIAVAEKIIKEYKTKPVFDVKYEMIEFSRRIIIESITNTICKNLK